MKGFLLTIALTMFVVAISMPGCSTGDQPDGLTGVNNSQQMVDGHGHQAQITESFRSRGRTTKASQGPSQMSHIE